MRQHLSKLFVGCALLSISSLALAEKIWTVPELVEKNVQARGGLEKIHAMHSLRLTGKLLVNQDQFELTSIQIYKRGTLVRQEATLQGLTLVQAYDGKNGWQINPFQGRKDPQRMSGDDSKGMVESALEFDGALVDWQAKGATLEYLGTEDVDGTLAHKIKLTRANADVEYVFLEPEHFLEIRTLSQRVEHGTQLDIETDFGDYEIVDGIAIPFAVESGKKGSSDKQKSLVDKAEINPVVDDEVFNFPSAKSAK